jgi:hypothetical protein
METSGKLTIEDIDLILCYYEKLMVSFPAAMNMSETIQHWKDRKSHLIRKQNLQKPKPTR